MAWYAIRTSPGAQVPQREFAVEKTAVRKNKRGEQINKGYRIVPSLNPKVSAIENALIAAKIDHYMPADFKVIRNRKKTRGHIIRRYPLLVGYVYVRISNDADWYKIGSKELSCVVAGRVENNGKPLEISVVDILALRTIEGRKQMEADRELHKRTSAAKAELVKTASKALSAAKRRINPGVRVKVQWGKLAGREAIVQGWEDQERVRVIAEGLENSQVMAIPVDTVKLVA